MKGTRVVGVIHQATEEVIIRARQWLNILGIPYELITLPQYKLEDKVKAWDIVIVFGKLAYNVANQLTIPLTTLIELPSLNKLEKRQENIQERIEAAAILEKLKQDIKSGQFIPHILQVDKKDLPILDERQILLLKEGLSSLGLGSFILEKDGKKIEISNTGQFFTDAEIKLTFYQLLLLFISMKTFNVEGVEICQYSAQQSFK